MSSIQGLGGPDRSGPVQKVTTNPIQKEIAAQPPPTPARGPDKLELSGVKHLLAALKSNDIRIEKVRQIKAQIEDGTYETPEKLDAAADKLLDDLLR